MVGNLVGDLDGDFVGALTGDGNGAFVGALTGEFTVSTGQSFPAHPGMYWVPWVTPDQILLFGAIHANLRFCAAQIDSETLYVARI